MTISTENATPPKARNSNFWVHIQIKSKSQFESALRDMEEAEFLDLVDSGVVHFQWKVSQNVELQPKSLQNTISECRRQY